MSLVSVLDLHLACSQAMEVYILKVGNSAKKKLLRKTLHIRRKIKEANILVLNISKDIRLFHQAKKTLQTNNQQEVYNTINTINQLTSRQLQSNTKTWYHTHVSQQQVSSLDQHVAAQDLHSAFTLLLYSKQQTKKLPQKCANSKSRCLYIYQTGMSDNPMVSSTYLLNTRHQPIYFLTYILLSIKYGQHSLDWTNDNDNLTLHI